MQSKGGCLGMLAGLFSHPAAGAAAPGSPYGANQPKAPVNFHYGRKPLLSPAERSFLGVLDAALGSHFRIFVKVRLADLLQINAFKTQWRSHFNRIAAKHIDFVICEPHTLAVRFAVELDDRSHSSASAAETDAFKNRAMAAAGIQLLRFSAKQSYSVSEVRGKFLPSPPPLPTARS